MSAETDSLGESPPPIARRRNLVLRLAPGGWRWDAGLRTALAFAIPAGLLVACGRSSWALFACFGAFAVMYGEGRAYRVRWQVISIAGVALLACVALGIAAGAGLRDFAPAWLIEVVLLPLIAMIGAYVIDAARLGPPGMMFFLVACSGALAASRAGIPADGILIATALGVAGSLAVSMAGWLIAPDRPTRLAVTQAVRGVDDYAAAREQGIATAPQRHRAAEALWNGWATVYDAGLSDRAETTPLVSELLAAHRRLAEAAPSSDADPQGIPLARPTIRYRLRRSLTLDSHATATALRVAVAGVLAGVIAGATGSQHPHWAILTALIILQAGPDRVHGGVRALQRLLGTALGLGMFAAVIQLQPKGFALVAVLAVLQFGVELFITRNYALAAIFFTPVALIAGGAGLGGQAIGAVMRDRLAETAIGVVVALLTLRYVLPHAHRRTLAWTDRRVRGGALELLECLRAQPINATPAMVLRRDLQFDLIGAMRSGLDSAHNDPGWAGPVWPAHMDLLHSGYDLLAHCRTVPPGARLPGIERWERTFA
ncbi:FUSC family protein [Nocardia sp. NPDC004722]